MRPYLVRFLASMGYVGLLKPAPGTLASGAALVIASLCEGNSAALIAIAVGTLFIGCIVAAPAREAFGSKDPSSFVLDEWCGMTLALIFLPYTVGAYAAAFILFRIFDILKPWGIRKLDRMDHPSSIMLDDVLAGLYANVFAQILIRLVPALQH